MRSRVAILGAGGFVGARLVELALRGGRVEVVPIVRAVRSLGRIAHLGAPYRVGDAADPASLARALDGCDVVVDLTKGEPQDILRITRNVHAAATAAGARRLIHLSSAAVYGRVDRPDLPDDAMPRQGHWMPYAREKGRAENYLRERMRDPRLDVVVLRPGLIWGPGSPYVLGSATALRDGTAYLVGDGSGICALIYVDDLARGIETVATHGGGASGFYNVADDGITTWHGYYGALAAGLGVDAGSIWRVPADRYRAGVRDVLRDVRGRSGYRWLKGRLSVETRAAIKLRVARSVTRGTARPTGVGRPVVTREMWELQTTRHRLPTERFAATFGATDRTSFEVAMAASLAWLRFIGLADAA